MVCSYCHSFLDLPIVIVDCNMEGCTSRLYHICQGQYVAMHKIDLEGAEQKIYPDCVDELWMGGKTDKLKKVGHINI